MATGMIGLYLRAISNALLRRKDGSLIQDFASIGALIAYCSYRHLSDGWPQKTTRRLVPCDLPLFAIEPPRRRTALAVAEAAEPLHRQCSGPLFWTIQVLRFPSARFLRFYLAAN